MRADKVGRDTLLAQIVQMVAEAQRSRAPIQRLADQVAALVRAGGHLRRRSSPLLAWARSVPSRGWRYGLVAAVSVLIIACPCALGTRHSHVHHGRRRAAAHRPAC